MKLQTVLTGLVLLALGTIGVAQGGHHRKIVRSTGWVDCAPGVFEVPRDQRGGSQWSSRASTYRARSGTYATTDIGRGGGVPETRWAPMDTFTMHLDGSSSLIRFRRVMGPHGREVMQSNVTHFPPVGDSRVGASTHVPVAPPPGARVAIPDSICGSDVVTPKRRSAPPKLATKDVPL